MRRPIAVQRANELVSFFVQHQTMTQASGAMMAKVLTEMHAELVKYLLTVDDKDTQ